VGAVLVDRSKRGGEAKIEPQGCLLSFVL
jgi:hypothetical protein